MSVSSLFSPNTFGLNCNELNVAGTLTAGALDFESATVSGNITVEGTTTLNGALNVTTDLATFSNGVHITSGGNLMVDSTANMANVDAVNLRSNGTLVVVDGTILGGTVNMSALTFNDVPQQVVASDPSSMPTAGTLYLKDLGESSGNATFTWITPGQAQPATCVLNAIRSGTFCMCALTVGPVSTTGGGVYTANITLPYPLTTNFAGDASELIGTVSFSNTNLITGGNIQSQAGSNQALLGFNTSALVAATNIYATFIYQGLAVGP